MSEVINIKRIGNAKLNKLYNDFDEIITTGQKLKVYSLGKVIY